MFKQNANILFQGDSITDGNRARNEDLNHILGHGYQYIIAAKLGEEAAEKNYNFLNRGISGNRVVDLYGRWKEDTLNLNPDVLSILIGVNDVGREFEEKMGIDSIKYEKVYRLLLEETKEYNPEIMLILCEPFILPVGNVKANWEKWNEEIVKYQEIVKKLATEYNAVYVSLQVEFNKACEKAEPSYWIWDGVHPTTSGHEIIAKAWMRAVSNIQVK